MNEIETFIQQAREKGLDEATIRSGLEAKSWDKAQINLALSGLEVPTPITAKSPQHTSDSHPSLSPLMAALHHVILWFFTVSSAVAIGGTVASLYGTNVSSTTLASMIAVTLTTFIPYTILFSIFLVKSHKQPLLVPSKVWSIITICLHSIGAMIAAIVVVVNSITGGQPMYLVSAALILLLDLIVVFTYCFAAFGFGPLAKLRRVAITLYLPILIIMFGILFGLSLLRLGPARSDEILRKDLTETTKKIATQTEKDNKLPDSISNLTSNPAISYAKISTKTYQLCGTFQLANASDYPSYYGGSSNTDSYVDESMFYANQPGKNCFDFTSDHLKNKKESSGVDIFGL